jgi:hypothetical protein
VELITGQAATRHLSTELGGLTEARMIAWGAQPLGDVTLFTRLFVTTASEYVVHYAESTSNLLAQSIRITPSIARRLYLHLPHQLLSERCAFPIAGPLRPSSGQHN